MKKLLKEKATMVYKVGLPGKNGETPRDYLRKINSLKNFFGSEDPADTINLDASSNDMSN